MLKELTIKNFAIIEDLNISFNNGMSVFLGETGAGKSIIIDAFSLLLGERANNSKIRFGESRAFVEAVLEIKNIDASLEEYKDEGDLFTFTRIINSEGNNICKINGITVNISTLKNTLGKRVNLHSQHDLFYLLDSKYHLSLLDKFSSSEINQIKEEYDKKYSEYVSKNDEFEKLKSMNLNEDLDYLKYQLNEILEVDVQENEIEDLELEASRISKFSKLSTNVNNVITILDGDKGVNELLYEAKHYIGCVSDDPLFSEYESKIIEMYENCKDLSSCIKQSFNSLDIDESRMAYIEDRMYKINKLKRKYGNSFENIEKAKNDFQTKIDLFDNREYTLSKLETEIKELYDEVYCIAGKLSLKRKHTSEILEKQIEKELKDLYLDKTVFKVNFKDCELTKTGKDKVEFLISTNVGESLKPLSVVASGGETSRLTLGLNVVFNEVFDISLAIFDEVDSGVSGKVATSVGEKIKGLSRKYQTLVISHLPQVLSFADNFYYVYKKVENNKTKSYVKVLDKNEKIYELAKILSGSDLPSDTFIENAKELLFDK